MLGLSLLLHIALIAFIPGFGIFLPRGDAPYIEIETVLFMPEGDEGLGNEADAEQDASALGEFSVQPELSVSEPERFEAPNVMAEWERVVLEREVQPLERPRTEELPQNRPIPEPDALSVQLEARAEIPGTVAESPEHFERPESVLHDEVTEHAEHAFDITALRGEEPPAEAEAEFMGRGIPALPDNRASLRPSPRTQTSRTRAAEPIAPQARRFQQPEASVDAMPRLRLPERPDSLEVEEESLHLASEEIFLPPRVAVQPNVDETPGFQARPLPEIAKVSAVAIMPEREVEESRPVLTQESLPPARDFRQKDRERTQISAPLEADLSFPDRHEDMVEAELPKLTPERREASPEPQEAEDEPPFPLLAKDVINAQPKAVPRRAVSVPPTRVEPAPAGPEFRKIQPKTPAASMQALLPVNQALAFERPEPPERIEKLVEKEASRRQEATIEATPTPDAVFSVKRSTALRAKESSSGAKPLPRLFADSTPAQRERTTLSDPLPLKRVFGARRAGLLPVTREVLTAFEDEKAGLEPEDELLEEAETDESGGDAIEFTIEGPASGRKVIYKPLKLPEVAIDMEVDIRLKFWVLPDGSIGEVVPLQRGDVNLERTAIQYLKSWRFTPSTSEREVWGIIPIRYSLQ